MKKKLLVFSLLSNLTTLTPKKRVNKTFADGTKLEASGGINYKLKKTITTTPGMRLENAILNKMNALIKMHDLMIENEKNKNNTQKIKDFDENNKKIARFKTKFEAYQMQEKSLLNTIDATKRKNVLSRSGSNSLILRSAQTSSPEPSAKETKELSDGTIISKDSKLGVKITTLTLGNSTTGSMQNNLTKRLNELTNRLTKELVSKNPNKKKIDLLTFEKKLREEEVDELDKSITNSTYTQETAMKK